MNMSLFYSLLRTLAKVAGGALVTFGVVTSDQAAVIGQQSDLIVGALMILVPVLSDIYIRKFSKKAKADSGELQSSWIVGVFAVLLLLPLVGCAGSVQDRQRSADNIFGDAKVGLAGASLLVATYNLFPACTDGGLPPPLCYNESIADILNKGLEVAGATIESSEKVFAAANTDADARMNAANAALTAVQELEKNLKKFGVAKNKTG